MFNLNVSIAVSLNDAITRGDRLHAPAAQPPLVYWCDCMLIFPDPDSYCDNYVSTSATNASLSDCNMPCNGNASEFCGAGNRLDLYAAGSTTPSVKTASSTPAPPPGWFSLGCYNDSSAARSLSKPTYIQVPMTVEACTSACAKAGYTFAGEPQQHR
jgi:hypothetical protein